MSQITDFTGVFRANANSGKPGEPARVLKRNRQPVSCAACRARKLKCDRQRPCGSCIKRGDDSSCDFTNSSRSTHSAASRATEAQFRLQRLEEAITGLIRAGHIPSTVSRQEPGADINQQQHTPLYSPEEVQIAADSTGGHFIQDSEANYAGATHWATILKDVQDLQDCLDVGTDQHGDDSMASSSEQQAPAFLLGAIPLVTLDSVLNALPPRPVVDTLLSVYFNAKYMAIPYLHVPTFHREYESFWRDPTSTSFLWMSILFSAICAGSIISAGSGKTIVGFTDTNATTRFTNMASQCLVTGGYNQTRPFVIEALLMYSMCKFMQSVDPNVEVWEIFGHLTRLAMRMGYHRDPKHLSAKISAFEGEMRRRTWFIVETFDLLTSFQLGMPPIIQEAQSDTELPRNLLDEDLDENCKELPPARSDLDPTPMLYFCYKGQLMRVFRRAVCHALSIKQPSYDQTLKIDSELHDVHQRIPPSLKIKPISASFTDQAYVIMNRLNLELMYLKSLCILHRGYLSYDKANTTAHYSRKTCGDAALQILHYHEEFSKESEPGGQLYNDRWMLSNLAMHDFLLAAMIVCLDLYESTRLGSISPNPDTSLKQQALVISYEIWVRRRDVSKDAVRASEILGRMLKRLSIPMKEPESDQNAMTTAFRIGSQIPATPFSSAQSYKQYSVNNDVPSTSLPALGNTSVPMISRDQNLTGTSSPLSTSIDPNILDTSWPLDIMFTQTEEIDWNVIDAYLMDRQD